MRRHSKASTAGSTKRRAKTKPALLACALAACATVALLVVGPAGASTTRFLQETFGSSAQPTFPADRGIAVDQSTNEVYVLDATEDTLYRFNSDGSASNFSALGSNAIDGEGSGDETPQLGLSIPSSRKESQIAIDESGTATDGDIYVAGGSAHRVDIFSSEGEYKGQLTEYSGGALGETCGVAVDGSGNVYVGDYSHGVHVYEPAANPPVNGDNTATFTTAANPCTMAAGTGATEGFLFVDRYNGELLKLDAATGEVKYTIASGASTVSVDPSSGHIFSARNTGGSSTIDEYDASGASEASLVSSFKPGGTAEGVAANGASEEVYVSRSGTENVEVYGATKVIPDVTTEAPTSNTGVRATLAGMVNPDGVELSECFFEWGQGSGSTAYTDTAPCAETPGEIGAGTAPVAVHADISGLIPQGTRYHYRLVGVNPNATINGSNQEFTTPDTVITEAATGVAPNEATLNGTVNPDTATISECVFEWGPEKPFYESTQNYPEAAPCVPGPGGIGSGTTPVAVEAVLDELHPGTRYAYRLRVDTGTGSIYGENELVQSSGPAILATWAGNVTYTEASLRTQISPEGSATTYRFEYGKTTAYGSETSELTVGSDSEAHELSRFLEDLEPGATYHYRVIANSGVAENVGPDRAFSTYQRFSANTDCPNQAFRIGSSAPLPDCRAYEMVSPVDKNGGDIAPNINLLSYKLVRRMQGSLDGNKVTYSSRTAFGDAVSNRYTNQYLASRAPSGWATHGISAPLNTTIGGPLSNIEFNTFFETFTPDLSVGWLIDENRTPLTEGGVEGEKNYYWRDNANDTYHAIAISPFQAYVQGFTPDLSHMLIDSYDSSGNLHAYDFTGEELHPLGLLPNGSLVSASVAGSALSGIGTDSNLFNPISEDGSRVFWMYNARTDGSGRLFLRENPGEDQSAVNGSEECTEPEKACTISISDPIIGPIAEAIFWGASADGSHLLMGAGGSDFLSDLYEVDVDAGTHSLIAHDVRGVLGASEDLSYVYFVSTEPLAPGATEGEQNLYLRRDGEITFIAALAKVDTGKNREEGGSAAEKTLAGIDAVSGYNVVGLSPIERASRITPDGRQIAFQSIRSLTGYDNADANNGEPDVEVFHYDADTAKLTCASCNPSGARPEGEPLHKPYSKPSALVEDYSHTDARRWTAAWLPTWEQSMHASRALSDDGKRVFFNSYDALVAQDTNGVQDVYQWEAQGTGGCTKPDGCIGLISDGESAQRSEFIDASASGGDVFFETNAGLLPQDPGLIDIYDARVNGGFPQPPSPPECFGDACQSVPSPPNDPTPASAGFRGAGDPKPGAAHNCGAQARRARTLARRARVLRRKARHARSKRRTKVLRRRSSRYARRATSYSKRATRCRTNRRVER